MHECDLLLLLGTDFPYENFMPTKPKIAQVDIRAEQDARSGVLHHRDDVVYQMIGRVVPACRCRLAGRAKAPARDAVDMISPVNFAAKLQNA